MTTYIFGGGAAKGAFTLHMLQQLEKRNEKLSEYDHMAGASAGAIIAFFMSTCTSFKHAIWVLDHITERLEHILEENTWCNKSQCSICCYALKILCCGCNISTTILGDHLNNLIQNFQKEYHLTALQRKLTVQVTQWEEEPKIVNMTWNKGTLVDKQLLNYVVASASLPLVFSSKIIQNKRYIDGALEHCIPHQALQDSLHQQRQVKVFLTHPMHNKLKSNMTYRSHNWTALTSIIDNIKHNSCHEFIYKTLKNQQYVKVCGKCNKVLTDNTKSICTQCYKHHNYAHYIASEVWQYEHDPEIKCVIYRPETLLSSVMTLSATDLQLIHQHKIQLHIPTTLGQWL